MWVKKNFWKVPGRYALLYLYHLFVLGAWRAGRVGRMWAHLRCEVYRFWEYKTFEMRLRGGAMKRIPDSPGKPDPRVLQYD
ncbi:MAG TPA: hypothetical protein VFN09_05940, partial [Rhodanobacteraceae bacterium]|nr:hypothetical protein [Rhodanobacteraceae bacterium]